MARLEQVHLYTEVSVQATYQPVLFTCLPPLHTSLTSPVEEVLHDGHERGHLAEDEAAMVTSLELGQHPVQHLKLPRGPIQLGTAGRKRDSNSN